MLNTSIQLVDDEYSMKDVERQKRCNLYDDGKQGIFTDIAVVDTPRNNKIITFSKHFVRMHGDDDEKSNEIILDAVPAGEGKIIFDKSVRSKVEDIVFPFKDKIPFYGPLSDVEDENMTIFMTEEAGDLLVNDGVDLSLMEEEISEIKNIQVNSEQSDLADATYAVRKNIASIKRQMNACRGKIFLGKPDWRYLSYKDFLMKLVEVGSTPDCSKFLKLDAKLRKDKALMDKYSAAIMSESLGEIYLPDCINLNDVMLPSYDVMDERFKPEMFAANLLDSRLNIKLSEIPDIPMFSIIDV